MKQFSSYKSGLITEAVSPEDVDAMKTLLKKYFTKYGIRTHCNTAETIIDNVKYTSCLVYNPTTDRGAWISWKSTFNSTEIDSITFTDRVALAIYNTDNGGTMIAKATINAKGAPITKMISITRQILCGELGISKDAIISVAGTLNLFEFPGEQVTESIDELQKTKARVQSKLSYARKNGKETAELEAELEAIRKQIAAERVGDKSKVQVLHNDDVDKFEAEFEERANPQDRFKDMLRYVRMCLKGRVPSIILCGAPGVGKTYNVMKEVRKYIQPDNFRKISGKCTPLALYTTLFEMQGEGQLVILDDCDSIITDMGAINILKAALDSSDQRIVAYGTGRPAEMPEEMAVAHPEWGLSPDAKGRYFFPTRFEYNGSVIIITNMRAGQVDTALRNRSMLCDLDFTTEECLGIIKLIAPDIAKEKKIPLDACEKAYDYLMGLAERGTDMELSIRSFLAVANIYADDADFHDEASTKRMIREQMRLQFAKGGKRY